MNNKFWIYFIHHDNSNTDIKGVYLWKILQELQDAMKRMTPSLLGEDCTYEQWKHIANKGQYNFFVTWLDDKGEQYLSDICNTNIVEDASNRLLDQFDGSLFALQMATEVDDAEVLAADIVDVVVNLANVIKEKQ